MTSSTLIARHRRSWSPRALALHRLWAATLAEQELADADSPAARALGRAARALASAAAQTYLADRQAAAEADR